MNWVQQEASCRDFSSTPLAHLLQSRKPQPTISHGYILSQPARFTIQVQRSFAHLSWWLLFLTPWFVWWLQSLRVISAPALVTHSLSPTEMSLIHVGHPRTQGVSFGMEVFFPRVLLQLHVSPCISFRVSSVQEWLLLPLRYIHAGVQWDPLLGCRSGVWWSPTLVSEVVRPGCDQHGAAHGPSPHTAPAAESLPCMPHTWDKYFKWD